MAVLREDDDFEAIFNFNAPTANVPAVLMEGDEADQLTPPHQHRVEPPNTFEMPASSSWNSYHASAPVGRMEHNEDTLDVADLDTLDAASPGQVIPAELHQADQLIVMEAPFGGPFAVTFAGSPNFQVLIDDNKYISDNKHFYTRMMEKFAVKMTWNWNETKRPLFVRATMLFSDEKYSNEKVQCCTSHGAGPEEISQHFLRSACSDTPGVSYCGDVERPGSRLSVAVLFPAQPEPGQTYFSHTYQFHCMGTCASGVHNRPIQILFTLEDNGMVLDRQTVKATVHRTPCRPYNKAMRKLGLAEADSHGNKRRRIAEASAPERPLPNPLAADAGAGIYTLPVIEISGAGPFKHALDYIKMSLRAQQFGATDEETKELCRRGIRACEIAEREQLPKEEAPGWLTDKMESPRKFNDCYFYYYSTCTKGDNCVFRHEPSALGCETMCVQWQQGKCLDKRCKLRHMELRKNRKQIPCYWENQPGGCRKKHCPFQHKNPEARTDGIAPSQPIPATAKNTTGAPGAVEVEPVLTAAPAPHPQHVPPAGMVMPQLLWQQQPRQVVLDSAILGVLPASDMLGRRVPPAPHDPSAPYAALPVDPLVVSFEEESDNESVPSSTPTKMVSPDEGLKTGGKTQELILLEQIQAEAAAYYSYDDARPSTLEAIVPERRTVRTKLSSKYERLSLDELSGRPRAPDHKRNSLDFKILTLDEIRARKKRVSEPIQPSIEEPIYGKKRKLSTHDTMLAPNKVVKLVRSNSIVYRKVDTTGTVATGKSVPDDTESSRKRTFSIDSDVLIINDEELDEGLQALSTNLLGSKIRKFDNEPKGIQIKLIHTPSESEDSLCDTNISDSNVKDAVQCVNEANPIVASIIVVDDDTADSDLESEVIVRQPIVVSDEDSLLETDLSDKTSEVIEINAVVLNEEKLSKDSVIMKVLEDSSNDSGSPEIENSLKSSSVPDVVASCHEDRYKMRMGEKESEQVLMNEIDEILNEESL